MLGGTCRATSRFAAGVCVYGAPTPEYVKCNLAARAGAGRLSSLGRTAGPQHAPCCRRLSRPVPDWSLGLGHLEQRAASTHTREMGPPHPCSPHRRAGRQPPHAGARCRRDTRTSAGATPPSTAHSAGPGPAEAAVSSERPPPLRARRVPRQAPGWSGGSSVRRGARATGEGGGSALTERIGASPRAKGVAPGERRS